MARTSKSGKAATKTAKASPASGVKAATKSATKKAAAKKPTASRGKKKTTKKSAGESTTSTKKATPASGAKANKAGATKSGTAKSGAAKSGTTKSGTTKSTTRAKKARSPFDSRFLEKMRKSLKSERDVYERQAKQLRAEADSLVADLDPGDVQFDEESGEGDTIAVERGRDLALAAQALEMINEIDHAMSKFDLGTYGVCEVSGEPIPKERLEAIPWAREKVEYKVGGFGRR